LRTETIEQRVAVVRRFAAFADLYPWQWTPAEAEAWFSEMSPKGARPKAFSTVRGYQLTLRSFCDYLTDQRYGWVAQCVERFGSPPTQILHEWNTVVHVSDFEGRPGRRALNYDEVQRYSMPRTRRWSISAIVPGRAHCRHCGTSSC
jgi:hypothetical protein